MSAKEQNNTIELAEYVKKHGLTVGFRIPPGGHVEVVGIKDPATGDRYPLQLISACLGAQAVKDERALLTYIDTEAEEMDEIVCASLSVGVAENIALDIVSEGNFVLGNVNALGTDIHVVGRLIFPEGLDDDDEEDSDYVGEDDEEDDEDDEFDYDDEENGYEESDLDEDDYDDDAFAPPSKVKIEELPSDDDEEKEEEEMIKKPKKSGSQQSSNGVAKREEPDSKRAKIDAANSKAAKDDKVKKDEKQDSKKLEAKSLSTPASAKKDQAAKAQHDASKSKTDSAVVAKKVIDFIKEELKKAKTIKGTDLGSAIVAKFGIAFKKMGFPEKTLLKFVEAHANGAILIDNDTFKLKG